MRRTAGYFCFGVLMTAACAASAQNTSAPPPSDAAPDVAIFATVHARELRFDEAPQVNVTFTGNVNGHPNQTVWHSDRTNLPDQVQPHVTYRDIGIRLTITSILPDIEQILDEALAPAAAAATAAPKQQPKPKQKKHR